MPSMVKEEPSVHSSHVSDALGVNVSIARTSYAADPNYRRDVAIFFSRVCALLEIGRWDAAGEGREVSRYARSTCRVEGNDKFGGREPPKKMKEDKDNAKSPRTIVS